MNYQNTIFNGEYYIFTPHNNKQKKKTQKKEIEIKKYYYAKNHNFSKNNNELPAEFRNKIIVGNSEEVLKKLPDNCIDLILTSPPYNSGRRYDNYNDSINWEDYFQKLFAILKECIRVLKFGGRIVINVQPVVSHNVPLHHIISNFFIQQKLIWMGEVIWDKQHYNCRTTAWGSWKSPSSPYMKHTWEFLEVFAKGTLIHSGNRELIDITATEFRKWVVAKWNIAPEHDMVRYEHPAMFPEELAKRVIKLFTYKNDVVLDPFNGVGTTTVVAKRLGRIYLGVDISEKYCRKAQERIIDEGNIQRKLFD